MEQVLAFTTIIVLGEIFFNLFVYMASDEDIELATTVSLVMHAFVGITVLLAWAVSVVV